MLKRASRTRPLAILDEVPIRHTHSLCVRDRPASGLLDTGIIAIIVEKVTLSV